MVTVGMNYRVIDGMESVFEKRFEALLGEMQNVPGHEHTALFENTFEDRSYLVLSEWENREAFDAFVGSPAFRTVTDWGEEHVLAARPKHEIYRAEALR